MADVVEQFIVDVHAQLATILGYTVPADVQIAPLDEGKERLKNVKPPHVLWTIAGLTYGPGEDASDGTKSFGSEFQELGIRTWHNSLEEERLLQRAVLKALRNVAGGPQLEFGTFSPKDHRHVTKGVMFEGDVTLKLQMPDDLTDQQLTAIITGQSHDVFFDYPQGGSEDVGC